MKQAIILAAGEGRRLRPFTVYKPKAMICVAGKPIIRYVIEALAENGIREIVIVAGYKKEQLYDYIGNGKILGVDIEYITQREQLGTAHALAQARFVADEEFLVLPGDKLIETNTIAELIQSRPYSILVKKEENPSRYGIIVMDRGLITNIIDPSTVVENNNNIVNTGIYVFNRNIFDYIKSILDIPMVLRDMLKNGVNIFAIMTEQPWLDVVYPWDMIGLNAVILRNISHSQSGTIEPGVCLRGQVSIGKGTIIRANSYVIGPMVIGEGCDIGPNACIFPATSIGNNVIVSPFTRIKNSIIGDGVHIGSGCDIEDSIIDRNCTIGGHFYASAEETEMQVDWQIYMVKIGAMIGEGCKINNGVIAQPGLIAGNYCRIKSLKTINGTFADGSIVA